MTSLAARAELATSNLNLAVIDTHVSDLMKECALPGFQFSISLSGEILVERSYGCSDVNSHQALSLEDRFRVASLSKPITSAAIFTLIDRGALSLDRRVFGPEGILNDHDTKADWIADITIDHLLTHTAGGWGTINGDPMFHEPTLDRSQFIDYVLQRFKLISPPGSSFLYSNFGYYLLGRVIEQISTQSYEDYVREAVLRKCGITDMQIADIARANNEVRYYGQNGEDPYSLNIRRMDADGGWIGTARDLSRFGSLIVGPFRNPKIIQSDALVEQMLRATPANTQYARGWALDGGQYYLHGGSLPGSSALLCIQRSGLSFAAVCNSRPAHPAVDVEMQKLFRIITARAIEHNDSD
jgi:CubicO group peptidase (beta-lactamase class C family)